jgi:hypothetical protein
MIAATAGDFLETPADKRSFVLRLVVRHIFSLILCVLCIFAATWIIVNGIELARDKPWNGVIATWIVSGLLALLFWIGATNTQAIMLDLWREALQPLERIDGSEIVLARKRSNRLLQTVVHLAWLTGWICVVASKWPDPGVVVLGGVFFILPAVLRLKAMWLPPASDWAPLVIDSTGFEDRSGAYGKIAWSDVTAVDWDGAISVKLVEPRTPVSGGKWRLEIRPRHMPRKKANEVIIRMHGLPSAHHAFRLMRAYWRLSRRTNPGNNSTITRAAR